MENKIIKYIATNMSPIDTKITSSATVRDVLLLNFPLSCTRWLTATMILNRVARIPWIQADVFRNVEFIIWAPHSSLHSSCPSAQSNLPLHFSAIEMLRSSDLQKKWFVQFSSSELSPQSSWRLHTLSNVIQRLFLHEKISFVYRPLPNLLAMVRVLFFVRV